jgi:peptide chain release factor 2
LPSSSKAFGGVFDLAVRRTRLSEIEQALAKPGAWDRPDELTPMLKEKSQLSGQVTQWEDLSRAKADLDEWLVMAREEQTAEVLGALSEQIEKLSAKLEQAEMALLLGNEGDVGGAILEIHSGAGGTEAQDWAEMLLRMYVRWAERRQFTIKQLDLLPGEEAGVKSVTLSISGPYAYGLLKGEAGIHRLIRISPFDASGRRHTSFASVDALPDAEDDISIVVKDEDVRIDVFRSSGPGGQNVNKTSSAVRITHLATNIVVSCQNEKSQHRNKDTAFKVLKARLLELEIRKRDAERQAQYANKEAIGFGSQIRTYTLQPYRLVKDHRSGSEATNVDAVLDGDLDKLIRDQLLHRHVS